MPKRKYSDIYTPPTRINPQSKQDPDRTSINGLKRQIRNAKRLLARDNVPADSRIVHERALAEYERELEDEMRKRHRSDMIKKYHFVRFLDRKSATKELKKLLRKEKEINESKSPSQEIDRDSLAQRIHAARVNLSYTIYYPLTEKYISLYADKSQEKPAKESTKADSDTEGQDYERMSDTPTRSQSRASESSKLAMWKIIEKGMQEGQEQLDLLREGKLYQLSASADEDRSATGDDHGWERVGSEYISATTNGGRTKRKGKEGGIMANAKKKDVKISSVRHEKRDVDHDSDGGFFE